MTLDAWLSFLERCAAADDVVLAAPYIKLDALAQVLENVNPRASVVCYTRWSPLDIATGSSDVACRTLVKDRGGSFRLHGSLHAKYYRADSHVLIGSANLTQSGMGSSKSANLEILTDSPPSFDWRAFENRLSSESRGLSDEEFALWESCPVSQSELPDNSYPVMGLGNWRPRARRPEYVWFAYVGKTLSSVEQAELAAADLQALGIPRGLDRRAFDSWLQAALWQSEIVNLVFESTDLADETALWDKLCNEWGLEDRAAAARLVETVGNWTQMYNEDRPANQG